MKTLMEYLKFNCRWYADLIENIAIFFFNLESYEMRWSKEAIKKPAKPLVFRRINAVRRFVFSRRWYPSTGKAHQCSGRGSSAIVWTIRQHGLVMECLCLNVHSFNESRHLGLRQCCHQPLIQLENEIKKWNWEWNVVVV